MTGFGSDAGLAAKPVRAFISAGSNIDPERHLRAALRALRRRYGELALSSVYRNRAEGFAGEDFLNLVVGITTTEPPEAVIAELERLHVEAGRVRGPDPFAPRTLDLDLVLYGDRIDPVLRLPRPDVLRYAFVLGPLAEIAPECRHPVTGQTMAALWDAFDRAAHPLQRLPASCLDETPTPAA